MTDRTRFSDPRCSQTVRIGEDSSCSVSSDDSESAAATNSVRLVLRTRRLVIVCSPSPNASERAFRLRFNLKAGAYDAKKPYRLVIASDTDMQEVEFRIDVALADDFGFDL